MPCTGASISEARRAISPSFSTSQTKTLRPASWVSSALRRVSERTLYSTLAPCSSSVFATNQATLLRLATPKTRNVFPPSSRKSGMGGRVEAKERGSRRVAASGEWRRESSEWRVASRITDACTVMRPVGKSCFPTLHSHARYSLLPHCLIVPEVSTPRRNRRSSRGCRLLS